VNDYYLIHIEGKTPLEVERPEVMPEEGDILIFTEHWGLPGFAPGNIYKPGDEVHLLRRTDEAPYGKLSSLGNWVAFTKNGKSIWSNIEWLLASRTLTPDGQPKTVTQEPTQDPQVGV
jgi:hypothetical protein